MLFSITKRSLLLKTIRMDEDRLTACSYPQDQSDTKSPGHNVQAFPDTARGNSLGLSHQQDEKVRAENLGFDNKSSMNPRTFHGESDHKQRAFQCDEMYHHFGAPSVRNTNIPKANINNNFLRCRSDSSKELFTRQLDNDGISSQAETCGLIGSSESFDDLNCNPKMFIPTQNNNYAQTVCDSQIHEVAETHDAFSSAIIRGPHSVDSQSIPLSGSQNENDVFNSEDRKKVLPYSFMISNTGFHCDNRPNYSTPQSSRSNVEFSVEHDSGFPETSNIDRSPTYGAEETEVKTAMPADQGNFFRNAIESESSGRCRTQVSMKDVGVQGFVKTSRVAAPSDDDTIEVDSQVMEVEVDDSDGDPESAETPAPQTEVSQSHQDPIPGTSSLETDSDGGDARGQESAKQSEHSPTTSITANGEKIDMVEEEKSEKEKLRIAEDDNEKEEDSTEMEHLPGVNSTRAEETLSLGNIAGSEDVKKRGNGSDDSKEKLQSRNDEETPEKLGGNDVTVSETEQEHSRGEEKHVAHQFEAEKELNGSTLNMGSEDEGGMAQDESQGESGTINPEAEQDAEESESRESKGKKEGLTADSGDQQEKEVELELQKEKYEGSRHQEGQGPPRTEKTICEGADRESLTPEKVCEKSELELDEKSKTDLKLPEHVEIGEIELEVTDTKIVSEEIDEKSASEGKHEESEAEKKMQEESDIEIEIREKSDVEKEAPVKSEVEETHEKSEPEESQKKIESKGEMPEKLEPDEDHDKSDLEGVREKFEPENKREKSETEEVHDKSEPEEGDRKSETEEKLEKLEIEDVHDKPQAEEGDEKSEQGKTEFEPEEGHEKSQPEEVLKKSQFESEEGWSEAEEHKKSEHGEGEQSEAVGLQEKSETEETLEKSERELQSAEMQVETEIAEKQGEIQISEQDGSVEKTEIILDETCEGSEIGSEVAKTPSYSLEAQDEGEQPSEKLEDAMGEKPEEHEDVVLPKSQVEDVSHDEISDINGHMEPSSSDAIQTNSAVEPLESPRDKIEAEKSEKQDGLESGNADDQETKMENEITERDLEEEVAGERGQDTGIQDESDTDHVLQETDIAKEMMIDAEAVHQEPHEMDFDKQSEVLEENVRSVTPSEVTIIYDKEVKSESLDSKIPTDVSEETGQPEILDTHDVKVEFVTEKEVELDEQEAPPDDENLLIQEKEIKPSETSIDVLEKTDDAEVDESDLNERKKNELRAGGEKAEASDEKLEVAELLPQQVSDLEETEVTQEIAVGENESQEVQSLIKVDIDVGTSEEPGPEECSGTVQDTPVEESLEKQIVPSTPPKGDEMQEEDGGIHLEAETSKLEREEEIKKDVNTFELAAVDHVAISEDAEAMQLDSEVVEEPLIEEPQSEQTLESLEDLELIGALDIKPLPLGITEIESKDEKDAEVVPFEAIEGSVQIKEFPEIKTEESPASEIESVEETLLTQKRMYLVEEPSVDEEEAPETVAVEGAGNACIEEKTEKVIFEGETEHSEKKEIEDSDEGLLILDHPEAREVVVTSLAKSPSETRETEVTTFPVDGDSTAPPESATEECDSESKETVDEEQKEGKHPSKKLFQKTRIGELDEDIETAVSVEHLEEVTEGHVEPVSIGDVETAVKMLEDTDVSEESEILLAVTETNHPLVADGDQKEFEEFGERDLFATTIETGQQESPKQEVPVELSKPTEETAEEIPPKPSVPSPRKKKSEGKKKRKIPVSRSSSRSSPKKGSATVSPKQEQGPISPKKPIASKLGASPKKPPSAKNGAISPSQAPSSEQKKLPPIKAPVGQAPSPNVKNVRSKIGSLENIKHRPKGGEKKVSTVKLEWQAQSKVGSLEKASYKPGGGDKKIVTQKLDFKDKAQSKVGSKDNLKHKPGGGAVKVETQKLVFKEKASPKVGSMDNVKHSAGGGSVKIKSEKLTFRERASPKVGSLSGSEKGSAHGSETQSPVPPVTPPPGEAMPAVSENGEDQDSKPDASPVPDSSPAKEETTDHLEENDIGESTPTRDDPSTPSKERLVEAGVDRSPSGDIQPEC